MNNPRKIIAASFVLLFGTLVASGSAFAQADPHNLLDTVTITGTDFAIGLNTGTDIFDSLVPQDSSNDFIDCVSTAAGGLTCIDGNDVVNWTSPIDPAAPNPSTLFNCDVDLPFNTRKGPGCTAIAQDAEGAIYLGGRRNGKGNILIKIVEDPSGVCGTLPDSYTEFTGSGGDFCWATIQTGRPTLVDIDVIEGGLAAGFSLGEKQLLVLEERKTVLIYKNFDADPADTIVVDVASGKRGFGLAPKEEILNAMLMEYVRPSVEDLSGVDRPGQSDFFVYVATNKGRLIAVNPDGTPSGVAPLDINNLSSQPLCPVGEESFDVAQGPNAGVVYATDRNSCVLYGFATTSDMTSGDFAGFNVASGKFAQISTSINDEILMAEVFLPPLTISAFPGFGFNLGGCAGDCTLISSGGESAASLANVQSVGGDEGVILFHVTGMPHCGWIPNTCVGLLDGRQEIIDGTVEEAVVWLLDSANVPGTTPALLRLNPDSNDYAPELLVYNATPFLPRDVTDLYENSDEAPTGLPPLLFPPEYRAQSKNGFFYDALFFVPEPGVQTDGVLTLDVDVDLLTGGKFECGTVGPLERDIVVRASERWKSITAEYISGDNFQGSMSNADCFNPTRSRTGGISMFPINFELTPKPATLHDGVWKSDISCPSCDFDDAVFAKLYVKLYDELKSHRMELACTDTDDVGSMKPLSDARCTALEANWLNGKSKLTRALEASIIPEPEGNCSGGSRNFGSVASQLQNYGSLLVDPALGPFGTDLANRSGEQAARVETLVHALHQMLIPSIPSCPLGLVEDDTRWIQGIHIVD